MTIQATLVKEKPIFPDETHSVGYECKYSYSTEDLIVRKVEYEYGMTGKYMTGKYSTDIKEMPVELLWEIAFPLDYPLSQISQVCKEALSVLNELRRDKVISLYQYQLFLNAIQRTQD